LSTRLRTISGAIHAAPLSAIFGFSHYILSYRIVVRGGSDAETSKSSRLYYMIRDHISPFNVARV
jgi:hypothetical protein